MNRINQGGTPRGYDSEKLFDLSKDGFAVSKK